MKKVTKVATALLAATLSVLPLASCKSKKKVANSSTDVQIYLWKSGYGAEFMKEIVADFNKKQDKYRVTLEYDESAATIIKTLSLGSSNTYDLYFTMLNTNQYNKDFENLDDVLDYTVAGENTTIRNKYYDYLSDGVKNADGTTNFLTYGNGWCGFVYNADIIDGVKYRLPNTTNELDMLITEIKGDKTLKGVKAPLIFYNNDDNNGYLNYAAYVWEAQYDGLDYYYDTTLALKAADGTTPSKDVFVAKDGRYKALKVLESIVTPTTVHDAHTNKNFTDVQTLFLDGEAVFMVNGSWLMNESTGTKNNFGMMKMPVISSIVEKLEDTEMDDATLSEIISEVDAGATSSSLCSRNDFNRIKEARNLLYNNAAEQYVFVPKYSVAKEGSKEFLKYFYSDEGLAKFMTVTGLPNSARLSDESKFNVNTLDNWHKQQFTLSKEMNAVTNTITKSKLFINNNTNQFASVPYAQSLCAGNSKDKLTADGIWNKIVAKINENWADWSK
mgnify:FL=1